MRHASSATLDSIEPLLKGIRNVEGLRERVRGIFYAKSIAYLHFHEDPAGLFADVKLNGSWKRIDVTSSRAKRELLATIQLDVQAPSRPQATRAARKPRRSETPART